jgi:hypothetical protein
MTITQDLPLIQGYYIHMDSNKSESNRVQQLKIRERILASLRRKSNLEILIIQLSGHVPSPTYTATKRRLTSNGWQLHEKQIRSSEHFSDEAFTNFDLIITLSSNYFQNKIPVAFDHLSPTPQHPTA